QARLVARPALVKADHRVVVRETEENAERHALWLRARHETLVAQLVVELAGESAAALAAEADVRAPPERGRHDRILGPGREATGTGTLLPGHHGQRDVAPVADQVDETR